MTSFLDMHYPPTSRNSFNLLKTSKLTMVLLETALWNLFFLCKFTKAVIYVTVVIADKIKYSFFLLSLIFSKIVSIIIYCTCICVIFLYFLLLSGYYFSNSYIFKKMSSNVYELNINHFICISKYNQKSAVFCFAFDTYNWNDQRHVNCDTPIINI